MIHTSLDLNIYKRMTFAFLRFFQLVSLKKISAKHLCNTAYFDSRPTGEKKVRLALSQRKRNPKGYYYSPLPTYYKILA